MAGARYFTASDEIIYESTDDYFNIRDRKDREVDESSDQTSAFAYEIYYLVHLGR